MKKSHIKSSLQSHNDPFDCNNPNQTFQNENNIKFTFLQSFDGIVSSVKKPTLKTQFFLTIRNPLVFEKSRYLIILKKKSGEPHEIYRLETKLETKQYQKTKIDMYNNQYPTKIVRMCKIHIGLDLNIRNGQYRVFIYKQSHETKNLISYLYDDKRITGAYVTQASITPQIQKYINNEPQYINRITFHKHQLVPIGEKYLIIIDNDQDFLNWIDNKVKSATSQTPESIDNTQIHTKIVQYIHQYFNKDKIFMSQIHPTYINQTIDQLAHHVYDDLIQNYFDLYITDSIKKQIINTSKPAFNDIMAERMKKYDSIFANKQLNKEKLTSWFTAWNLDAYMERIITNNYNWYIINEAMELVSQFPNYPQLKETMEQVTNQVYIMYRKILNYESKYYQEEKELSQI